MKNYGDKKKVEFTGRDINEINKAAKAGFVTLKRWHYAEMLKMVSYYGYDDNHSVEFAEGFVKMIINAVAKQNWEDAQKYIDNSAESMWNSFTESYKKQLAPMDRFVTVNA